MVDVVLPATALIFRNVPGTVDVAGSGKVYKHGLTPTTQSMLSTRYSQLPFFCVVNGAHIRNTLPEGMLIAMCRLTYVRVEIHRSSDSYA